MRETEELDLNQNSLKKNIFANSRCVLYRQTKVKKKAEKEENESVEEGEQGNVMQLMAARMKFISKYVCALNVCCIRALAPIKYQ
jgi:hypothetical protein